MLSQQVPVLWLTGPAGVGKSAGPPSYFSRTLGATIGRAFWLYSKDLVDTTQVPDWRDRVGLL